MTNIKYAGFIWQKISRRDWEFEGGETNKNLLKLPDKKRPHRNHFLRLVGPVK